MIADRNAFIVRLRRTQEDTENKEAKYIDTHKLISGLEKS